MDRSERNSGPAAKDRINKAPTSDAQGGAREVDVTGNVERRGEDPSPDDRARGERSSKEPAGADQA